MSSRRGAFVGGKGNQKGASESLQWALVTPLLLFTVLGVIQVGVWMHARTVVGQAAAAAAEEAAVLTATAQAGSEIGRRLAVQGGLLEVDVSVTRSADSVTATASGRAVLLLDLGQGRVTSSVTRPRERVTVP